MPYEPVDVIEVRCWGSRVGAIALDDRSGAYAFEYDPRWRRGGVELAPTTMPTRSGTTVFVFPALAADTFHRLPAMVADALPDAFGNALTTAYLAAEGVPAETITPLDRLAYLGARAVGALEFRPVRGPRTRTATAIELGDLVLAARAALHGDLATEQGLTDAIRRLIAVGTSAGGARAKAVVALNPSTGELRSGQVPAQEGFERWIVKLDGIGPEPDLGTGAAYGRIEYAYSLMAREAGIDMTECRLLEEGGRAHFMTRRFDRGPGGEKIHVQTLCALGELDYRLIGAHDYAQWFQLVDRLALPVETRTEVFRRMVFNVATANHDDHTKNVSFLLPRDGRWSLAPAYDVTHAYSPTSRWTHQHLMAVNGRTTGITRDDLLAVGDRFGVPRTARTIDDVLGAVARWPDRAEEAAVPGEVAASVGRDIREASALLGARS